MPLVTDKLINFVDTCARIRCTAQRRSGECTAPLSLRPPLIASACASSCACAASLRRAPCRACACLPRAAAATVVGKGPARTQHASMPMVGAIHLRRRRHTCFVKRRLVFTGVVMDVCSKYTGARNVPNRGARAQVE
eukprot:854222-Pleurochrysis_carterae.AAC.1